jgi:hypothetical protein
VACPGCGDVQLPLLNNRVVDNTRICWGSFVRHDELSMVPREESQDYWGHGVEL